MEKIIAKNIDETYIQITCNDGVAYELRDAFTFEVPGARFTPQFRAKLWDGKIRLYDVRKRLIYRGLIQQIISFAQDRNYTISYDDFDNEFSINEANEFIESLEQHPQIEIARQWVRMGNAAQLAGSGQFDPVISGETEQKQWQQKTSYQWIRGEAKQNVFAGHSVRAGFDWGQGPWINPELQTGPNGIPYAGVELSLGQGIMMDKRRAEYLKSRAYGALYDNESRAEKNTLFYSASIRFVYWLNYKAQLELM